MIRIKKYITTAILCLTIFTLAGCGGNQGTSDTNKPEAYTEPNPYKDGLTLEEAKESRNEYGSMYIKKGDKFYPLVEAADYCNWGDGKMEIREEYREYQKNIYTIDVKNENNINILEPNDQLVEVYEKDEYGFFEKMKGSSGYTIKKHFEYKYGDNEDNYLSSGFDLLEKINGNKYDTSMQVSFSEKYFSDPDSILYHTRSNYAEVDFSEVQHLGNAKLTYFDSFMLKGCDLGYMFDLNKNEEITLQTRYDGCADIENTTYKANLKYFNYPDDILSENLDITYYEYEATEDGYLILDSSNLTSGYYITHIDNYEPIHYIFKVK